MSDPFASLRNDESKLTPGWERTKAPPTKKLPDIAATFKTIDDCHVVTDVFLPEPSLGHGSVEKRPVLIFFHGGGFLLGHRHGIAQLQLNDWLRRGWIVLAPDYRLCPQVTIDEGPIADAQSLLSWLVAGESGLDGEIAKTGSPIRADFDKIISSGSSSGGTLAYSLVFGKSLPHVAAIVDFFGGKDFENPIWRKSHPILMHAECSPEQIQILMDERPVATNGPITGGRGQRQATIWQAARQQYAMSMLDSPMFMDTFLPSLDFKRIDAVLNVDEETVKRWPPTWILHGLEDERVSITLSRKMHQMLLDAGVPCEMIEVAGEGHAFVASMAADSEAFKLQLGVFDEVEKLIGGR